MICFERVRYLREEHELTQKIIANILGVDKSTYAAWERGRDLFPLKRLISIANYYGVSLDFITSQSEKRTYKDLKENINPELLKKRIKEVRKENGYTQERLAEALNTTHSAISTYENGHLVMPLILLYQLSSLCHISMDYLLGRTNHKYLEKELVQS